MAKVELNTIDFCNWHLISVNTKKEPENTGYISSETLHQLQRNLKAAKEMTDKKIVLVMHHHPIPVNTPLIDDYILKNYTDFWCALEETECPVPLVITGHVHNDYVMYKNKVEIITCPSTAFQFPKAVTDFTIEKSIGLNIWHFSDNNYEKETIYL